MAGSAKQDCFAQQVDCCRVLTTSASDAIVLPHTEMARLRRLELAISNYKIVPASLILRTPISPPLDDKFIKEKE
jgi:hypothetical protein